MKTKDPLKAIIDNYNKAIIALSNHITSELDCYCDESFTCQWHNLLIDIDDSVDKLIKAYKQELRKSKPVQNPPALGK